MNKYGGLLEKIAEDLNIVKGSGESETNWKARVIYSAIGQLAIASLYDVQKGKNSISIIHFRRRVKKLFDSYMSMYPEMKSVFKNTADDLAKEFYNTLCRSGCLYHSPNRITASAFRFGSKGNTLFVRGAALKERVFRSGLGAFMPLSNGLKSDSISSLYGIDDTNLSDQWHQLTESIRWSSEPLTSDVEYLTTSPPFKQGYFKDRPDKDCKISLLRAGNHKPYIYYFYRYNNGQISISQIPSWLAEKGGYRKISNCCIFSRGNLLPTYYHLDGDLVKIKIRYLYPPAEQNLIRLYSWPGSYEVRSTKSYRQSFGDFIRFLSKSVFFAIKEEFEQIGYRFVEK